MPDEDETREVVIDGRAIDRALADADEKSTMRLDEDTQVDLPVPSRSLTRLRTAVDWILPLDAVPFLQKSLGDLMWLGLSPAATQLLHRVDGISSTTVLLERAGIPAADVVYELRELVQKGIVRFRAA